MPEVSRRGLLMGAGALAAGSVALSGGVHLQRWLAQPRARVGVYKADYEGNLVDVFVRALRETPRALASAKGGRVVLKPNLVEAHPGRPINTDPRVIVALAEAFRHHGAREVVVAEGPGHHRDTELVLHLTGFEEHLKAAGLPFVDLNIDDTAAVQLPTNYTGFGSLHLPKTVLSADLFVSVAKMKTHHWVGATLTLKNLFGVVPGAVYGWPKNPLHHVGVEQSIVDLWQAVRPGLAVVDGIVGMQGDGPIMGDPKPAGVVLLGEQLPAVDATAARIMGLQPDRMGYLAVAARLGGTVSAGRITQVGELPTPTPFSLLPQFQHLRG